MKKYALRVVDCLGSFLQVAVRCLGRHGNGVWLSQRVDVYTPLDIVVEAHHRGAKIVESVIDAESLETGSQLREVVAEAFIMRRARLPHELAELVSVNECKVSYVSAPA